MKTDFSQEPFEHDRGSPSLHASSTVGSRRTDWLPNSIVYQINTWSWIRRWSLLKEKSFTLGELPEEAWDQLAETGASAVWLMGVWERSPKGVALSLENQPLMKELRQEYPDLKDSEVIGSPYCVWKFVVDSRLGGESGLAHARSKLQQRGIRLILDFV